jgi:hypothetical protein
LSWLMPCWLRKAGWNGGLERRVRLLPSRTGLYFLLAMCLFPCATRC